jgi:sigma-E factor negative regulatory protein RseA
MSFKPEEISALMDAALTKHKQTASLATLLDDTEAVGYWERYHLVGSALRGQLSGSDLQLAERVRLALADLPELVPQNFAHPQPPRWYWAGAGGLALAASALLAVVVMTPTSPPTAPALASAPVVVPVPALPPAAVNRSKPSPQLNRYLVGHYAASSGDTGVLPFVTLVGYEGRSGAR